VDGSRLVDGLGRVLAIRQAQHQLVAGNLANADTPGFRARALDFDGLLERAFEARDGDDVVRGRVVEEEPAPWATDGNSVQLERETDRMTANLVQYQAVASGLSRHLALLRFAAGDGR
jgi:flagellar basal-body rod protein FlgB